MAPREPVSTSESAPAAPVSSLADLHLHTVYSDGMCSPEMLINAVVAEGRLRVIAITDHDTLAGNWVARDHLERFPELGEHLELIPGVEVSSRDGHILGLWVESDVPKGLSAADTVAAIHAQGGVAIAAHPFTFALRLLGLKGVGRLIATVPFDAVEVANSNPTEIGGNTCTLLYNRALGRRLPEVGGSDAHFLSVVGRTGTRFPGTKASDLRNAITSGTTRSFGSPWTWHLASYLRDRSRLHRVLRERGISLHFL